VCKQCLFLAVLASTSLLASEKTYWYNGDPNVLDALRQDVNGMGPGLTYDNFVVGAPGMMVNGLFSDDFMNASISQAFWEIRSGVSEGNGGTVVASGTSAATQTDTGLAGFHFEIYRVEIGGLHVYLTPGTYWLAVAPVLAGTAESSFVATTSGTNAVGLPLAQDGNSYFNSSYYSSNFEAATALLDPQLEDSGSVDFSEGVLGSPVPEPGTGVLAGGLMLLAGALRAGVTDRSRR
jgi:hypothetical protein